MIAYQELEASLWAYGSRSAFSKLELMRLQMYELRNALAHGLFWDMTDGA